MAVDREGSPIALKEGTRVNGGGETDWCLSQRRVLTIYGRRNSEKLGRMANARSVPMKALILVSQVVCVHSSLLIDVDESGDRAGNKSSLR
jgi:hypothetical protein